MAMDRIQGSPLLRQGALDTFRKAREADSQEASKADSPTGESPAAQGQVSGDQAIISPAGKQLVDLRQAVDTGRAALAALPEVREEKVAAAKHRIGSGFYQSPAVRDKIASRLAGVFAGLNRIQT